VREICRIFRLPPHKLADMADATFSNVEEQNREYVDDCLMPWLVQWEQEIARKLLLPQERATLFPRYEVDGLLRGNATTRAAFYSTMYNIGAMSINEVREKEDLNSIGPDGDKHMVPVNLQPAGQIAVAEADDEGDQAGDEPAQRVDAAHRALLSEACERICRERERTGKADVARATALLLAPIMAAAASVHRSVDGAGIAARMANETTAAAMVAEGVKAIEERKR
jgi:hypothetical protein